MSEIFVQSFIDVDKWNAAKWKATAFLYDPKGSNLPCLGIVYENIKIGKQIFSDWIQRLGKVDVFEELRIAIIEGEIIGKGPGYSVHISSDPWHTEKRADANGIDFHAETVVVVGRINRMTPELGSPHLPRFKQEFQKHGRYFLIPVSPTLEPEFNYAIGKMEIYFRHVSEITKDDIDAVVFPENYFNNKGIVH